MSKHVCKVIEPVGLREIAARLGVPEQTPKTWRFRKVLPEPTGTLSGVPWWDWPVIEAWAKLRGLPREAADAGADVTPEG
jgi:hypothetical protein